MVLFSGLVREIARVISLRDGILTLESPLNPVVGDSISVNGSCLTVVDSKPAFFSLELSSNTQELVAIENYSGLVHIEPSIEVNKALHGHIVQGHIDCVGIIRELASGVRQNVVTIEAPSEAMLCIIPKGSVCVDGISLTVASVSDNSFSLVVIPHTMANTLFHTYRVGRRVNIETDVINRSVLHMLRRTGVLKDSGKSGSDVTWELVDRMSAMY